MKIKNISLIMLVFCLFGCKNSTSNDKREYSEKIDIKFEDNQQKEFFLVEVSIGLYTTGDYSDAFNSEKIAIFASDYNLSATNPDNYYVLYEETPIQDKYGYWLDKKGVVNYEFTKTYTIPEELFAGNISSILIGYAIFITGYEKPSFVQGKTIDFDVINNIVKIKLDV